jgi:hypothetical protein
MKTLFLMEYYEGALIFFELEGDYRKLDGINFADDDLPLSIQKKLYDLIFDKDGNYIINQLYEPTKDWDYFVKISFEP